MGEVSWPCLSSEPGCDPENCGKLGFYGSKKRGNKGKQQSGFQQVEESTLVFSRLLE